MNKTKGNDGDEKLKLDIVRAKDRSWADYMQAMLGSWDEEYCKKISQQYKTAKDIWNHHECQEKKLSEKNTDSEKSPSENLKEIIREAMAEIENYRERKDERDE